MKKSNKRRYLSVLLAVGVVIALTVAITGFGTLAQFTDTHNDNSDASYAGSVDLKLNGEDKDVKAFIKGENLKPGDTHNLGTVTVRNDGSVEATLTMKIINPMSYENGRTSAEKAAGDPAGQEYDPTSLDQNGGDGELWDQLKMEIYVDLNKDGQLQYNERIKTYQYLDMTDSYKLPLNTNLLSSTNHVPAETYDLEEGEEIDIGIVLKFIDDNNFWGSQNELKNNHAMTDDAKFTTVFDLVQK